MGSRIGQDGCRKSRCHRNSIPAPSIPYQVAVLTELSRPSIFVFVNLRDHQCVDERDEMNMRLSRTADFKGQREVKNEYFKQKKFFFKLFFYFYF